MKKALLCAVIGAAVAPCAFAQEKGFYAGLSLGQSKFKDACGSEPEVSVTSCKDNDTAWKIFGGYQFTPNLALELGYNDFGKAKGSANFAFANVPFPGTKDRSVGSKRIIDSCPTSSNASMSREERPGDDGW